MKGKQKMDKYKINDRVFITSKNLLGFVEKKVHMSNIYGIRVHGLHNPDSEDGLYWCRETELERNRSQRYEDDFVNMMLKLSRDLRRMNGLGSVFPNVIKKVIFNNPATIVIWSDDTKTVVKCQDNDNYDPEKGLAMAIAKRVFGNQGNFNNVFKKWLPE